MKNFNAYKMASQDVNSFLIVGKYTVGGVDTEITDGALVDIGALLDHDVFAGIKDYDKHEITAPLAATSTMIGIVDYVGVSEGDIMGNQYREGIKTAGLTCPAGRPVRVRLPQKMDKFFTTADNFIGTPEAGKYAIPTAGVNEWTVIDAVDTTALCVAISTSKPLTQGQIDVDNEFLCTVVNVI